MSHPPALLHHPFGHLPPVSASPSLVSALLEVRGRLLAALRPHRRAQERDLPPPGARQGGRPDLIGRAGATDLAYRITGKKEVVRTSYVLYVWKLLELCVSVSVYRFGRWLNFQFRDAV